MPDHEPDELAAARMELDRDMATFERQVAQALERLTDERNFLVSERMRLEEDRKRLMHQGRRLRLRWRQQGRRLERDLASRHELLASLVLRLEMESQKQQEQRARLDAEEQELAALRAKLLAGPAHGPMKSESPVPEAA